MKKIITILLVLAIGLSVIASCGKKQNVDIDGNVVTDNTKILDISTWDSGLSTKWLEALKTEFMKQNKGVAVNIIGTADMSAFYNTISTGISANDKDLYFSYAPKYIKYITGENSNKKFLEPLTDVINYKPEGEGKTIAEKFATSMDNFKFDDVCYALPFSNTVSGIVYNKNLFDKYNWKIPKTTNELKKLTLSMIETEEFTAAGKTPFVHFPGYWQSVAINWWLQYEGKQNFQNYWNFEGIDIYNLTQSEYQQAGLKEALKALYNIITQEGATYPGSNTLPFTTLQTRFLQNEISAMYPCGSWLETEASKNSEYDPSKINMRMMRTPLISSIIDKLEIDSEAELIKIIDYIDNGKQGTLPSSQSDVDKVEEAMFLSSNSNVEMFSMIPSYSPSKELAKKFLQFMYSDKGMAIYRNSLKVELPLEYSSAPEIDMSGWTEFAKSCYQLQQQQINVSRTANHPIYYNTGYHELFFDTPERRFTISSTTDKETVDQFLNREFNLLSSNWNVYLTSAGLKK